MHFMWGLIVGIVAASSVAFLLLRGVIVPKLKAAAKLAEADALRLWTQARRNAEGSARHAVGSAAADIEKKL